MDSTTAELWKVVYDVDNDSNLFIYICLITSFEPSVSDTTEADTDTGAMSDLGDMNQAAREYSSSGIGLLER